MKRYLPPIIILSVLGVCVVAGLIFSQQQNAKPNPKPVPVAEQGATPVHIRGVANAPVVIEEFGDFQCPPCGGLYPGLKQIESEYGSKVAVIFREFPLQQIHMHALEAAHAAEAAGAQGKFWEMHDRLYENQGTWANAPSARPFFVEYARQLGLDVDRFQTDMDSAPTSIRNLKDQDRGRAMGVGGTPTVFVNGQIVKAVNVNEIKFAIDSVLKDKGM